MVPEIAAEAPIIGYCSPGCVARAIPAPAADVTAKKGKKARRAKAARDRASEWQEPNRIDAKVSPVGVNQRIGDESPDVGAAAGQTAAQYNRVVVARRDESKCQQKFDVLLLGQKQCADKMHQCQYREHSENDRRDIEDRFAIHSRGSGGTHELRRLATRLQAGSVHTNEKGGREPSLEPRCGVIAAFAAGHIPSPPRARNCFGAPENLAAALLG